MFTKAGVKGHGVGFIFTDNQIVQERFLVRSLHTLYEHETVSTVQCRGTYTASTRVSHRGFDHTALSYCIYSALHHTKLSPYA